MQSLRYLSPTSSSSSRTVSLFSDDLFAAARSADAPGRARSRHTCALVDLRAVDMSEVTSADSRRFAIARMNNIGDGQVNQLRF